MVYEDVIEGKIDMIINALAKEYPDTDNKRWHAIKLLEKDKTITDAYPLPLSSVIDKSYEKDIISQKYDFIEEIISEVLVNKSAKEASTEKIDHYMTDKWLGLPLFLCIMALVFFLTFTIGDWLKGYFEIALELFSGSVSDFLASIHTNDMLVSLIVDGIISGVGGILTFLPNIFILFLAHSLSGYLLGLPLPS